MEVLEGLRGVQSVEVDLGRDLFRVTRRPAAVSVRQMVQAVDAIGYSARPVKHSSPFEPDALGR